MIELLAQPDSVAAPGNGAGPKRWNSLIQGIVQNPLRCRMALAVALLLGWYFPVYQSGVASIDQGRARLHKEQENLGSALQIDLLRNQLRLFEEGQPEHSDANEMVQYLVTGVRARPNKLVNLEPRGTQELGPLRLQQVNLVVEGSYHNLIALVHWIEADRRLFRIEKIRMELDQDRGGPRSDPAERACKLDLTILGFLR